MSFADNLRQSLMTPSQAPVSGSWHVVSLCLDETASEFLNVGVAFEHADAIEVRMLDSFERLQCLYDRRIDADSVQHLLMDIEATLDDYAGKKLPSSLSDTIRIGPPLFAQGETPEEIVDQFFHDVVTLARPVTGRQLRDFRYYTGKKLRTHLIPRLIEELGIEAGAVVLDHAYTLPLRNTKTIEVDVPLMSRNAVGSIVSGWYKSPIVVEKNILQAGQDLTLVSTHSERTPALSILLPSKDSGLSDREWTGVNDAAHRQLERLNRQGMEIISAHSNETLASKTAAWWRDRIAA